MDPHEGCTTMEVQVSPMTPDQSPRPNRYLPSNDHSAHQTPGRFTPWMESSARIDQQQMTRVADSQPGRREVRRLT